MVVPHGRHAAVRWGCSPAWPLELGVGWASSRRNRRYQLSSRWRGSPRVAVGLPPRHAATDARLGEPLCPHCFDYAGAVLWRAHAGELWHQFTLELRRELARRAGLSRSAFATAVRLSYAKVAECQRRGLVHFHAVIRLDGQGGPDTRPPGWATTEFLAASVLTAAGLVRLPAVGAGVVGPRVLRFGTQLDVRPVAGFDAGELVTPAGPRSTTCTRRKLSPTASGSSCCAPPTRESASTR
ncbi:replication initiator [Streptomyces sp. 4N509B]|uniref:replication initiator n=1 Tax=Streptomyces sp. 4N509B TaxID=3457413 RepID=UPI003FD621A6